MGPMALDTAFWQNRRVFVTGATGMIGSWLVKRLLDLDSFIVALVLDANPQSELFRSGDVQRVTVVNGRLEDLGVLQRAIAENEIETVFHLGAQTLVGVGYHAPWITLESNVRGSYNLMEACRLQRERIEQIIVASSDKAYGDSEVLPYTEEMPLKGRHPYDASKSCTDIIAQAYAHTYELPVAIARCGNVYGGADLNWSRIVPGTIRSLLWEEQPVLRSDGKFVRDYIYQKDVVNAYLVLAERFKDLQLQGHGFNFSTESWVKVEEMVSLIQKIMKKTHLNPIVLDQARAEIRDQSLSSQKAREMLGWKHEHSLESGLSETIAWYESFLGERS